MTDLSTIQQFRLGNEQAFEDLIRFEGPSLMAFILNYVHQNDLADDIFQDACMKIWDAREQLQNPDRFRSWMFQIVRHTVIDFLRSKNWKMNIAISGNSEVLSNLIDPGKSQKEQLIQRQMLGMIYDEVGNLDSETQELITLYYVNMLSFQEISVTLNMPYTTVYSKIKRAIASVKRSIKKQVSQNEDFINRDKLR